MIPALTAIGSPGGSGSAPPTGTLASIVGTIPSQFNFLVTGPNFTDFNAMDQQPAAGSVAVPAWKFYNSHLTSSAAVAPDGTMTGQKLFEDATNSAHYIDSYENASQFGMQYPPMVKTRFAMIAKPAGRNRIVLRLWMGNKSGNPEVSTGFDLAGLHAGYDNFVDPAGWTIQATSITALSGGWVLCMFDITMTSMDHNTFIPYIYLDAGSGTAARATTYAGDGTSGVYVWWAGILPIALWNLHTLAFFDDFNDLSTIDLTDSRASGFNWYIHNIFPNSPNTDFGWFTNPPSAPSHPTAFTISSPSILSINYTGVSANPGWQSQLISVAYTGDLTGTPTSYVGTAWPLPHIIEAMSAWDWTITTTGWAQFWGVTLPALTGTNPPDHVESDFYESSSGGSTGGSVADAFGPHLEQWHFASGTTSQLGGSMSASIFPPFDTLPAGFQTFMRKGIAHVDAASNDGTWGFCVCFLNGRSGSRQPWAIWGVGQQALCDQGSLGGPLGMLSLLNTQPMTIWLGGPENPPFNHQIDWVKVYRP